MLGHSRVQGLQENVFQLTSNTLSDFEEVTNLFLLYCSHYPVLAELHSILGKQGLLRFIDVFGGLRVPIPADVAGFDVRLSLLPEIATIFGEDILEKILVNFGGRYLRVPPQHVLRTAIRNVDIYIRLSSKDKQYGSAALARHYGVEKIDVWRAFQRVAKMLNPTVSEEEISSYVEIGTGGGEETRVAAV